MILWKERLKMKNDVLESVIFIDAAIGKTDRGNRKPISKTNLRIIKNKIDMAFSRIKGVTNDTMLLSPFMKVTQLIQELIENDGMVESTYYSKGAIIETLDDISHQLNLFVGKYYETHDFDFDDGSPEVVATLNKIIDSCINQGYYFGEEC